MAVRVFVVKHFGVTHHPPPPASSYIFTFRLADCFSQGQVGKISTRGFRFSKIHTSLLYLTGNYMEMWHNGEQASGATIAVGATKLRAAAQPARVSSLLPRLPSSPLLPSPLSISQSGLLLRCSSHIPSALCSPPVKLSFKADGSPQPPAKN